MNTLILLAILFAAVFFYIFKSFNSYNKNPYVSPNARYDAPFQAGQAANIYEEVLQSEFGLIAALTAKVAKADGNVCALEKEIITQTLDELSGYYSNQAKAREILQRIFDEEQRGHENLDLIARELYKYVKNDENKKQKIVEFLLNLSFIDRHLSATEEDTIRKIAAYLGLDAQKFNALFNSFAAYYQSSGSASAQDPYKILGLSADASAADLKARYKELVKKYHPDLLRGQGLGEAYIKEATEKLQEINAAYEQIRAQKNF